MPKQNKKKENIITESKKKKALPLHSRNFVIGSSLLLALILSLGVYFLIVGPQFDRVGLSREFDIAAAESSVTQRTAYLKQLQEMKANFEEIEASDIDLLAKMLPSGVATPELLSQLDVMARQSGVSLVGISIAEIEEEDSRSARQRLQAESSGEKETTNKDIKRINLNVEVTAYDYDQFKSFVDSVQTHVRVMDIEKFSYSTEKDTHTLRIVTYYLNSN